MVVLPIVNALVWIRGDDRDYRSRVEDVSEESLVLARPLDLPVGHSFTTGSRLHVSWPSERGMTVLPTVLVGQLTEGAVGLWIAEIAGKPWTEQRREYVRVPIVGPVRLTLGKQPNRGTERAGAEAIVLDLQLVDISEAAVRCTAKLDSLLAQAPAHSEVDVHLELGGTPFDIPGRTLKLVPSALVPELCEVVVLFEQPVRQADALRRFVFAQQLKGRASR
jgi:hypothetical protein